MTQPILTPELPDAAPTAQMRQCDCCAYGGEDTEPKPCEYRDDTGITEGWYCAECYRDWRNTP